MKEKQRQPQPDGAIISNLRYAYGMLFREYPITRLLFAVDGAGIGAVSVDRKPAARNDCGDAGKAKPCRICSGGGSGGHGDAAAQVGTECAQPEPCLLYNGVPKPDPDDAVL